MPYAVKQNGSWRAVNADWVLEEDETLSMTEPVADLLTPAKAAKLAALEAAYASAVDAGFDAVVQGATYHFPGTVDDALNLLGTERIAIRTGDSQLFRVTDVAAGVKTWLLMTPTQLSEVVDAGSAFKMGNVALLNVKQGLVAAATTVEEVDAVVW
jgi:hypothetical protein